MPFVSPAYLRYLESQFSNPNPTAASGRQDDPSLPPPAGPEEPTTAPFGPPSQGGPGSYPTPVTPTLPVGPTGLPDIGTPNPPSGYPPGMNPAGINLPIPPTGPFPGAPNDTVPLPTQEPQGPPPNTTTYPIPGNPFPTPVNAPAGGQPQAPGTPATPNPPLVSPPGVPPTGGTTPAGVNLSPTDHINMILNTLGLPPLPAGYNPTGGLPPGLTENPNIGGGAPIFSYNDPTLNTGPQWNPGGSIYGGRGLPIVPGSTAGPGNLGGAGLFYMGALPNSWLNQMGLNMAAGQYNGPLSPAQYKAILEAAMAANSQANAGQTDNTPGGGSQFRGTAPTQGR